VPSPIENAATEIERVIDAHGRQPNIGMLLPADSTAVVRRDLIVALAAKYRLPAVYPFGYFVPAGGLMAYGVDQNDMFRLAASYVDRILRGDQPAALPAQAPRLLSSGVRRRRGSKGPSISRLGRRWVYGYRPVSLWPPRR